MRCRRRRPLHWIRSRTGISRNSPTRSWITFCDEAVRSRLKDAMQGTEEVDSLRQRMTKVLEELSIERKSHRKKADQLKSRLAALRTKPQDEATRHEIEELDRERNKT